MKTNIAELKGIDFTIMLQAYSHMRSDFSLYACQTMEDCREFINTCWRRLTRLKALTQYRLRKFRELKRNYIRAVNRYYMSLESYYRLSLNGVGLTRADYERKQAQDKLYKLAD